MSTNLLSPKVLKSLDKEFEAAFGNSEAAIVLDQAKSLFTDAANLRKAARKLDEELEPVRRDLDAEAKSKAAILTMLKDLNAQKDAARTTLLKRHAEEIKVAKLNKADGTEFSQKIKWINAKVQEIFAADMHKKEVEYGRALAALDETHDRLSRATAEINAKMKAAWLAEAEANALLKSVGIVATKKEVMK